MYSKKTCFVIENITYSISDQINGFGLDEKMSVSDVYTNIDTDELFDFQNKNIMYYTREQHKRFLDKELVACLLYTSRCV